MLISGESDHLHGAERQVARFVLVRVYCRTSVPCESDIQVSRTTTWGTCSERHNQPESLMLAMRRFRAQRNLED